MDDVIGTLERTRVLAVMTCDDPDQAAAAARALRAGGLSCVEIAFRTPAAPEALRRVSGIDGLLAGAGTILEPAQARAAVAAGARFAVAPGTSRPVVEACAQAGLPFFPGVATPSEIETARSLGCRVLKVFPASTLGGPAFLRAVSAPYSDVRFVPTGGVDAGNLRDFLGVPSVLACGGSWMVDSSLLRDGHFENVERLAREAVAQAMRT